MPPSPPEICRTVQQNFKIRRPWFLLNMMFFPKNTRIFMQWSGVREPENPFFCNMNAMNPVYRPSLAQLRVDKVCIGYRHIQLTPKTRKP